MTEIVRDFRAQRVRLRGNVSSGNQRVDEALDQATSQRRKAVAECCGNLAPTPMPAPPKPIAQPILDHHLENNRKSATLWDDFSGHRDKVTTLLHGAAGDQLAVLGAGNCNDLDLGALAGRFRGIHLLDLDLDAVTRARARLPAPLAQQIVLHAPLDFSGAYDRLPGFRGKTLGAAQLNALPDEALGRALAGLPTLAGQVDTVLSACCLSQIMHSCYLALGRHDQLEAIATALARVHVRLLLSLVRPGGQVLLVSDMVSTETYPLEEMWGTQSPTALMGQLERAGNFLSGTAPTFIRRLFTSDPVAATLVDGAPTSIEPWLWRMGPDLTFLVYAVVARRRT
jgi:hypothetical protein